MFNQDQADWDKRRRSVIVNFSFSPANKLSRARFRCNSSRIVRRHDATFGAQFVTHFGLELVDVDRQIFVATKVLFDHFDDGFFVRPAKSNFGAVFELGFEPDVDDIIVPTTSSFPSILGLQATHDELLPAKPVHFLSHDLFDVLEHAQTKWCVGVDAGHNFVNKAGFNEQLGVLGRFVAGDSFTGFCEKL